VFTLVGTVFTLVPSLEFVSIRMTEEGTLSKMSVFENHNMTDGAQKLSLNSGIIHYVRSQ
jgi:hypothetical protein